MGRHVNCHGKANLDTFGGSKSCPPGHGIHKAGAGDGQLLDQAVVTVVDLSSEILRL